MKEVRELREALIELVRNAPDLTPEERAEAEEILRGKVHCQEQDKGR